MDKKELFFHNLENTFKAFFISIFFKKSKKISPREIDFGAIKKIVVVRQHDPLGDVLISTAILPNLIRAFPDAELDVIARPGLSEKDIFTNNPAIKEVVVFSKKEFFSPFKIFYFLNKIRRKRYDLAIIAGSTSISFTSLLLAYLSKAGIRAGYSGEHFGKQLYTETFLTTPVPYDETVVKHQAVRNLDILSYLNIPVPSNEHCMFISESEKAKALAKLEENGIFKPADIIIGIHLGANALQNRWPAANFAAISNYLIKTPGTKIVVFYGAKEKELIDSFRSLAVNKVYIQDPLPLREFAAMLSLLNLFICNDTGVLHVAAAVGTKTLAIFGPTDPKQWNPLGPSHHWFRNNNESVFSITPEEILAKIKEIL
ncbi:MAG: glycosyltransferase family 9 protein [Candidatus Firestonebacteria bacterium]